MREQPLAHIDLLIGRLCSASHVVYERDCALTDASIKPEHDVEIFHVNLFFLCVYAWNISPLLWQAKHSPTENILVRSIFSLIEVKLCHFYLCFFQSICSLYYACTIQSDCSLLGRENASSTLKGLKCLDLRVIT